MQAPAGKTPTRSLWIAALFTAGAVLAAFPFGYMLGLFAAWLIEGPEFGQLPALTIPLSIVGMIVFALLPYLQARTRLMIMIGGTIILLYVMPILVPPHPGR